MRRNDESRLAIAWLILMGLTVVSLAATCGGQSFEDKGGVALTVLMLSAFIKMRQVLDNFLELRKAGPYWRSFFTLMLGGLLLVLLGLGLAGFFFEKAS
jgi:hypothetical protein